MNKMNKTFLSLRMKLTLLMLFSAVANSSLFTLHSSLLRAQDVMVSVAPVSPVLPPQAGQYFNDPGQFFTIKLMNNSDEFQFVYMGMHVNMLTPEPEMVMATPGNGHIPREPLVVGPRQTKILNPIEMKNLFRYLTLDEIGMREDIYKADANGVVGLLPEGQYELYMQAYKWDPSLTQPVQLNRPNDGYCNFDICYKAQPPVFISPRAMVGNDPLSDLAVTRLDMNNPTQMFTWTPPSLNCGTKQVMFYYDLKVVKLDSEMPDVAIEKNAVEYEQSRLTTPTFSLPQAYLNKWKKDTTCIYAMQVTAHSMLKTTSASLNFSVLENDGKSDICLFRFYDPNHKPATPDVVSSGMAGTDVDSTKTGKPYTFEQPTLTKPVYDTKTGRKVFVGDSIVVDWRKAWFAGGRGTRQDTIKFDYTVALYKGDSADSLKNIFLSKPIYQNKVDSKAKNLSDTIKWDKLKGKVQAGDYLVLRVTAKNTNGKEVVTMQGDSLNYVDFAMAEHFKETFACGMNTSLVDNKTPIDHVPEKGKTLRISDWQLTLNDDVKQDKETKALSGTGWINWRAGHMNVRVAVKFDALMCNSDYIVYDGLCQTYPKDKDSDKEYTAEQAVDSLFSSWGLDNIWGDLGLPESVAKKVGSTADKEIDDVAKRFELGKYYSYFKKAENQWNKWKAGNALDLYFPTQLPDTIASLLPKDFSMQIASMMYTPKGAVMNVIGEYVLPKSDILGNDVLIFGAPRLCVQEGQFLPEDGVLALLSNFKIQDPGSSWYMTFKAPNEPMDPIDGCFLKWENNEFSGLGVEIAMTIPNLKRVVNGKVQDTPPILDLQATIKDSWGDWMGRITMDPFQVEDLPGWTFSPGKNIIFDHSYEENYDGNGLHFPGIAQMPSTYDPSKVNSYCKNDWNAWQGIYVDEISVQFPKWAVFGKGEQGLKISGQKMFFDNSGVTCDIAALNLMEAKTGKAGGWEFDLDQAKVIITQNNFDSCHIEGRFGIPLFGEKDSIDTNKGKVRFTCDIRHLTDGETTYYTYDKEGKRVAHKKKTYGDNPRMSYLFKTQQIDSLNFRSFVADVLPIKEQTYLVVAAEDQTDGETKTFVELNIAGQINIADSNSTVNYVRNYARKLPLNMDFRGIHFAKMRLANYSRKKSKEAYDLINTFGTDSIGINKIRSEQQWEQDHSDRYVLVDNKEIEINDQCYLDFGEWSFTSPKKKIGPFMVELRKYDFSYEQQILKLGIEGAIGFCDEKVTAAVGIDISTKLTIPKDYTNFSGYSLSDGKVEFRSVEVNSDLGMLNLTGRLEVKDDDEKWGKGYAGTLKLDVKELFSVDVAGGYYNKPAKDETSDDGYALGFFTANLKMDAKTSPLRFDPLVITRITGGFYFNCRPVYDAKTATFGDPEPQHGMVGVSFGLGLAATAGEETLSGDMDLNVIYDQDQHRLTTFMFKGNVKAVSGIVDANMQLLYQNDDMDRFLSLDITVEAGFKAGLSDAMGDLNKTLEKEKEKLDKFQEKLDAKVKDFQNDPMGSLAALNSDYESKTSDKDKEKNSDSGTKHGDKAADQQIKEKEMTKTERTNVEMGTVKIALNMKITWREKGVEKSPVKWHLYLGEPSKDNRCKIILIDFKSPIVSVNIGADAYLCIGNELPDNGQLPPIPTEISEFLNGGSESVNTNADLAKAENSRSKTVREMLGNVNGGVMVGASAWGFINVDLGLFYGYLKALAGFDLSLINYGNSAFCVNLKKQMGRDGWYAMGQFYAYLAAKFGLHIKLGRLIDKRIDIVDAGIGGVFECGLPSPSWVEGRARVKISLLGGLVKINKKFQFECGDRCVVFLGNALDNFNLFDSFTIGSDSLGIGWDPANAYTPSEAEGRAMFATTAALNSQYRLVDPSTLNDIKDDVLADSLFNIHASRTYIFNLDQDKNAKLGTNGVRLWEFDSEQDFNDLFKNSRWALTSFKAMMPSLESSITYAKRNLTCTEVVEDAEEHNLQLYLSLLKDNEVPVGVRDKQGIKFHLSDMHLKPGKVYMMMLTGTAYEVLNGQRYWCEMVDTVRMKTVYQKWMQHKFYFFCTKEKEDVPATLDDLQPYIALAYPAPGVGKVTNSEWDNDQAYSNDLVRPTIALNEDLRNTEFVNSGIIKWTLRTKYRNSQTFQKTEERNNTFVVNGNCFNMEPETPFSLYWNRSTDDNPLVDNLRITYTQPSYSALVTWMKEHKRSRMGVTMSYFNWYYKHWEANEANVPQDTVRHALYIANWLKTGIVDGAVDVDTLDIPKRVVVLYDSWFRRADRYSWSMALPSSDESKFTGSRGYTDPLPYERPFIGVRPLSPGPKYDYPGIGTYSVDPFTTYETGYLYEKMDGMRLKDPYAYFSYLSNWVFIGGRAIDSYNFDDIRTPHASETLTFSYNNMDIAGSSQIKGLRTWNTTKVVRDSMMNVWNDWNFNNRSQPQYPLPTRLGTDYDVAFPNQDGKAQVYYTPWKKNYASNWDQMQYGLDEFWKDFAAPYLVAEALSDALYDISKELTDKWTTTCTGSQFNQSIKDWNNLHRGQYLTVECRGFQVKVPYYQFPLIFGDCCYNGYDPITDRNISEGGRAFGSSIGQSNIIKARWKTYVSNLFWFRLRGGYPWNTSSDFNQFYTERHYRNKNYKFINRDKFDAVKAMSYISDLHAYVYRVNAYDTQTGLYVVQSVGAASGTDEGLYFKSKAVEKPADYTWANWLTNEIGRSPVMVNGKEYKAGTSGTTDYTEMAITPEMPSEAETTSAGSTESVAGKKTSLHDILGNSSTTSGQRMAEEAAYNMLKELAKSNLPSCAETLKTIKKQDPTLCSSLLHRLYTDMPEIKTQLEALLNGTTTRRNPLQDQGLPTPPSRRRNL